MAKAGYSIAIMLALAGSIDGAAVAQNDRGRLGQELRKVQVEEVVQDPRFVPSTGATRDQMYACDRYWFARDPDRARLKSSLGRDPCATSPSRR